MLKESAILWMVNQWTASFIQTRLREIPIAQGYNRLKHYGKSASIIQAEALYIRVSVEITRKRIKRGGEKDAQKVHQTIP